MVLNHLWISSNPNQVGSIHFLSIAEVERMFSLEAMTCEYASEKFTLFDLLIGAAA